MVRGFRIKECSLVRIFLIAGQDCGGMLACYEKIMIMIFLIVGQDCGGMLACCEKIMILIRL